jgi:hypothetical protein
MDALEKFLGLTMRLVSRIFQKTPYATASGALSHTCCAMSRHCEAALRVHSSSAARKAATASSRRVLLSPSAGQSHRLAPVEPNIYDDIQLRFTVPSAPRFGGPSGEASPRGLNKRPRFSKPTISTFVASGPGVSKNFSPLNRPKISK